MAGALLASVPVVIAYAFLMDYSVSGLVAGATSIDEPPLVPWTRRSPMASPKSVQ